MDPQHPVSPAADSGSLGSSGNANVLRAQRELVVDLSVRFLDALPLTTPTAATSLLLSVNALTLLPSAFGFTFVHLQHLDISNNELESLPESIGSLASLSVLKLANNKLSSLPESLGMLSGLVILDLSYNRFADLDFGLFANFTSLRSLKLDSNRLTTLPASLGRCYPTLTTLSVDSNPFAAPWDALVWPLLAPHRLSSTSGIDGDGDGTIRTLRKRASSRWDQFVGRVSTIRGRKSATGDVRVATADAVLVESDGAVHDPSIATLKSAPSTPARSLSPLLSIAVASEDSLSVTTTRAAYSNSLNVYAPVAEGDEDSMSPVLPMRTLSATPPTDLVSPAAVVVKIMPPLVPLSTATRDSGYSTESTAPKIRPLSGFSKLSTFDAHVQAEHMTGDFDAAKERPSRLSVLDFGRLTRSRSNDGSRGSSRRKTLTGLFLSGMSYTETDKDQSTSCLASPDHEPVVAQNEALRKLLDYLRDLWDISLVAERASMAVVDEASFTPPTAAYDSFNPSDYSAPPERRPRLLRNPKSSASLRAAVEASVEGEPKIFSTSDAMDAMMTKRRKIIEEILATERTYVQELECLDRLYVKASQDSRGCLTAEEFRLLFANITALTMFHRDHFLPSLEDCCAESLDAAPIGKVFADHSAYIRMYSAYVNNVDTATEQMERWKIAKGKKAWRKLCDDARRNPEHRQLSLQGYLLLPVQRIPRYYLLLKSLVQQTPRNHADYTDLRVGLEEISSRTEEINERKREFEKGSVVLALQQQIRGAERIPLVQPQRRFLFSSELTVQREYRRMAPAARRLSRSIGIIPGFDKAQDPRLGYTLSERLVDKMFVFMRFTDLVMQCRVAGDKTYEMIRWVDVPEAVDEAFSDMEPNRRNGSMDTDLGIIEPRADELRIVFPDAVIYATGDPDEAAKWR